MELHRISWTTRHGVHMLLLGLIMAVACTHSADIPNCDFHDTVNLTNSVQFANGSYLYEGVLIPAALTGTYDYELLFKDERIAVDTHVRGCVCALRSCIKFCCHPKSEKFVYERECSAQLETDLSYSPYVEVTLNNGSQLNVHVLNEFVVQQGIPCVDSYMLDPADSTAEWELFENGTLLRNYDMAYLSKGDYCFTPHNTDGTFVLSPMNCAVEYEPSFTDQLNSYAMLLSIPFMVLTIIVYLGIPELRNLHGKCLVCHLAPMAIAYTTLAVIAVSNIKFSHVSCSILGFSTYYCFISAFLWLSVISFDLWHNLRGNINGKIQRFTQNSRFFVYSMYAWGLPIALTILTIVAQLSDLEGSFNPGIGVDFCWLKPTEWSAMLYFYDILLVVIIFNTVMFVLTAIKICNLKKECERISASSDGKKRLMKQKDIYMLFLRLFIIMGISWIMEVASYVAGPTSFFIITDLCNAAQGVIIFIVFVCRRKVRHLIRKRFLRGDRNVTIQTDSTQSECSPEEIALQACAKIDI